MVTLQKEISVLKDAAKILKRIAKVERDQEVREAVNVIEVVIGDLEDRMKTVNMVQEWADKQ